MPTINNILIVENNDRGHSIDIIEPIGDGFQSVSIFPNQTDAGEKDFYFSFDRINLEIIQDFQAAIFDNTGKESSLLEVYQILISEMGGYPLIQGFVANLDDVRDLIGDHAEAARLTEMIPQHFRIGKSDEPAGVITDDTPRSSVLFR